MINYSNAELEKLVAEELQKCFAPISSIFVAALFVTDQSIYLGHNEEKQNPVVFEHGEMMALNKAVREERTPLINKIIMAGGGKVDKLKFYTPCYPCCNALLPYITPETKIILTPLKGPNDGLELTFAELWQSYDQLPYSKIGNIKNPELRLELGKKTILDDIDLDFITDLTSLGISNKISFYLTGSASGRGGVSTLLNKRTAHKYRDIDLIAIIPSNFEGTEKKIELLIIKHYGAFVKEDKSVPAHHNKKGVVFKKTFYFCGLKKDTLIDFTFSTDLMGTLAKNEYEVKNWFHQLS